MCLHGKWVDKWGIAVILLCITNIQEKIMFLSEMPNGAPFKVKQVDLGKEVGKRLADMGFTEGAEGTIIRRGILRDPLEIHILGYEVLIRRYEASGIVVEPLSA
jgi:ferrous iron transport protein A